MITKIRAAGASEVVQFGASWVEADTYLRTELMPSAKERGEEPVYVPPFDDKEVWKGHSGMIGEIAEQLDGKPDVVTCSVGGGGLFCGIMQGLDERFPSTSSSPPPRVLAVETRGADSLALSLANNELSTLPAITSKATSLGARTVCARAFEYARRENVRSVVLSDEEAMEGCLRFAEDERMMVELACGVGVAMCYGGRLKEVVDGLTEESRVVVVVCGGSNVGVAMLEEWAKELEGKAVR